jgi:serine protease Do
MFCADENQSGSVYARFSRRRMDRSWDGLEIRPTAIALFLSLFFTRLPLQAQEEPSPADLDAVLAVERVLTRAIERAEQSVVAIARVRRGPQPAPRVQSPDGQLIFPSQKNDPTDPDFVPNEYATGVIVGENGLILTNYHVLGDPSECDYYVWIDHRPYQATIKAEDPWMDLAVLEIKTQGLTPITFGDVTNLKKGQLVIVLGNPYALAKDGQASAARGIIANLHRPAPALSESREAMPRKSSLHHYGTLIQTDVKLLKGASGGALINWKGEMIGLTTSLAAPPGFEEAAGYAYPANEAFLRSLENLKQGRKADYGFLGVAPIHLTAFERQQGRFGARVQEIVAGTPAARTGLREDDVITHVNGVAVHDANELIRELSQAAAGAEVRLTVERPAGAGRPRSVLETVTLSKKFVAAPRPIIAEAEEPDWRGLRVDYATAIPQFDERIAAIDPEGCVAITEVAEGSPAWKADLRPRQFISHVENQRVATPKEFFETVASMDGAVQLRLTEKLGDGYTRAVEP